MAFLHMLEQLKVGATLEAFPNSDMLTLPLGTETIGVDPRGSEYCCQHAWAAPASADV